MRIRIVGDTVNGTDINFLLGASWQFRFSWGQIALWHKYQAIFDIRNPLVWRTKDHLRKNCY